MGVKGKSIEDIQVGDEISISKVVPMDEGIRYAEASGDYNPLHQDDSFAQMAGYRGKIVHGLYTYAFCGKLFTDWAEDPTRLKRLKARFSDPLYPGDTLTVKATVNKREEDMIYFDFEAENQEESKVIKRGEAEVSLK